MCKFARVGSTSLVSLLRYLYPLWPIYGNVTAQNTRSVSKLKLLQSILQQPTKLIGMLQEEIELIELNDFFFNRLGFFFLQCYIIIV